MKPLALVIENDAGTRKLLDVLLARVGFDVDLVATGSDALILLERVRYDVLFIDLLIPGVSGRDILTWLQREQPDALARSVVVSSSTPATLQGVRDEFPPVHTIRKPFELSEVIEFAQTTSAGRPRRTPTLVETFCRNSVRAGAKAGVIVTQDGQSIEPLLWYGYTRDVVESYFPMTVDHDYPLAAAIRSAEPSWIASIPRAVQDYPMLAPVWERSQTRAIAAVPLQHDGRVLGAAGWSFREPRLFSELEQQLLTAIAELVVESLTSGGSPSMVHTEA